LYLTIFQEDTGKIHVYYTSILLKHFPALCAPTAKRKSSSSTSCRREDKKIKGNCCTVIARSHGLSTSTYKTHDRSNEQRGRIGVTVTLDVVVVALTSAHTTLLHKPGGSAERSHLLTYQLTERPNLLRTRTWRTKSKLHIREPNVADRRSWSKVPSNIRVSGNFYCGHAAGWTDCGHCSRD
ncbi:unnamed protein product, partial [Amoebophrya sp. A120]